MSDLRFGDQVKVKNNLSKKDYPGVNYVMETFAGKTVTIAKILPHGNYLIKEDGGSWRWNDQMFELKKEETIWETTNEFNDMISSFQCDMSLARDGARDLKELDFSDTHLQKDIKLLEELEYMLRHGQARIQVLKND